MKESSDSDLSEEMHDQLSQLWTNAQQKRRAMISQLTPYHKRGNLSANHTAPARSIKELTDKQKLRDHSESVVVVGEGESQLFRLREQLQQSVLQGRQRELEVEMLRKTAQQLNNQNKYLTRQLRQEQYDQNNSKILNESSILPRPKQASKKKHKANRPEKLIKHTIDQTTIENHQNYQDFSHKRLVELVRSTSQYRSYVFYYDSNELSFLKKLQQQHKKNCERTPGQKERTLWAPKSLIQELKILNYKEGLNMGDDQIEQMIAQLKGHFQNKCEKRLSKLQESLEDKLKKTLRQGQNGIPYELVQIARARQRELSRWSSKRSATSIK